MKRVKPELRRDKGIRIALNELEMELLMKVAEWRVKVKGGDISRKGHCLMAREILLEKLKELTLKMSYEESKRGQKA